MGDTYVSTCTKSSQVCGLVVTAAVVAFKAFRCSSSHLCNCLTGIKQLLSYDNMQTPFVSFAGTELAELLAIREQYKKILESSFGSSNTFQSGRFDLGRKLKISSPPQNLPNIVSDHADDASLGNNLHINSFLCSIVYDSPNVGQNILLAETDLAIELRIYTSNHQTRFEYHKIDRNVNKLFFYYAIMHYFWDSFSGLAVVSLFSCARDCEA